MVSYTSSASDTALAPLTDPDIDSGPRTAKKHSFPCERRSSIVDDLDQVKALLWEQPLDLNIMKVEWEPLDPVPRAPNGYGKGSATFAVELDQRDAC